MKKLAFTALLGLASCATVQQVPHDGARFSLTVYGERVGIAYTYEDLARRFDASARTPLVTLDERDVVSYRSSEASSMLSGAIELTLTPDAAARVRAAESFDETQAFEVTLDGQRLYLGVIYVAIGAAAIATPVMHGTSAHQTELVDDVLVITNGLVVGSPVQVDDARLRAFFASTDRVEP